MPKKCTYCNEPENLEGYITPPMCAKHQDLVTVVSWLQGVDLPVTPDMVAAKLAVERERNDTWTLTPEEVPAMLADLLEAIDV